jgi:RimJ/RimL family protein N-acetyltransferase
VQIVRRGLAAYGSGMLTLPFPTPPLGDCDVALRPWREADIAALLEAFRDPVLERFSDWGARNRGRRRPLPRRLRSGSAAGEQLELALVLPHEPAVLAGGASLNSLSLSEGRAAVGYWLAPGARGRGIATRAVRLLARWAFGTLGLARLELTCGPDNEASQRVALRCGFTREGLLRSHVPFKGARRDTVVFGLLPGELR